MGHPKWRLFKESGGKDIIFNNSQQYKKGKSSKGHSAPPAFPPLTAAEQAQLYNNLSQCRTQEEQIIKPVVLSVVKEYAASYVPKAVMLDLPEPLTNLYNKQARDLKLGRVTRSSRSTILRHNCDQQYLWRTGTENVILFKITGSNNWNLKSVMYCMCTVYANLKCYVLDRHVFRVIW